MTADKTDFFSNFSKNISEPIHLTNKTDEVNEEIKHNCWILSAQPEIIAQTTPTDFLEFIQKVKDNYKNQLNKSRLDIDLIFYLWFDEMAGQLKFNFINSNHSLLPFGCKLRYAETPREIVDQYFKSESHDGIPWSELETVKTSEEIAEVDKPEKELQDNFVLTVYQDRIKKQK